MKTLRDRGRARARRRPRRRRPPPGSRSPRAAGRASTRSASRARTTASSTSPGTRARDLFHTAIARDGRLGATSPIQTGWTGHQDAALTVVPGGMRAFWGGIRTTDSTDPNRELNSALSTDGGASWQLRPGSVVPVGAQAYGSDASATTLPNGTTLQAFAGTLGTWVHCGARSGDPEYNFRPLGNYGNYPGIASDAGGRAMLAWFSSAEARRGVLAQGVDADGTPSGAAMTMPGPTR